MADLGSVRHDASPTARPAAESVLTVGGLGIERTMACGGVSLVNPASVQTADPRVS